jgi:hypothetical protein
VGETAVHAAKRKPDGCDLDSIHEQQQGGAGL